MMYDHFGSGPGLMARIKIAMLVIIFVIIAVMINLKFYRGMVVRDFLPELAVSGGFLLAVVIGIIWHAKTGDQES